MILRRFGIGLLLLLATAGMKTASAAPMAPSAEEFVGPFLSWVNVQREYGAVGDGKTDDTAALQRALEDLLHRKKGAVLYLPAGVYRITRTLGAARKEHTDNLGVSVIGEDPTRTILRWDGPKGGTVFQYDAWYSRISRLTLDGAGKASVALAYGDAFSSYNETSDMVFRDVETGIKMGTADAGQAENAVLRCRFLRCSKAGLVTDNFNSMDIWVWNSRFEECGYGLLNQAGNFHAWENLFLRSRVMDIGSKNLMVFSVINNTSIGSRQFLDWESGFAWGAQTSITGNRIEGTTGEAAVRLGSAGPFLFAYNTIRSRPGKTGPEVVMTWGDQVFVGNTYTVANAVKTDGRFRQLDERVVAPDQVKIAPPLLPGTPPRRVRKVFEVPVGADAATLQKALDAAAALKGQRPIVHVPMGSYSIASTLTLPARCDTQLVGDGVETATLLNWTGKAGEPLLRIEGPSAATVRELSIVAGDGAGILVTHCDQRGGRIYGDQVSVNGAGARDSVGLFVQGVEQSDILMRCLQGGSNLGAWVRVRGGVLRGQGKAAPGQVSVLCGATGTSQTPYWVEDGGRLLVRSVYHERSAEGDQALQLRGAGSLFIDATRLSYGTSLQRPLIELDGFRGDFALTSSLLLPVGSSAPPQVALRGDGSRMNVLVMANTFWQTQYGVKTIQVWTDTTQPHAHAALLLNNMNVNAPKPTASASDPAKARDGYDPVENRGAADDAFLRRMLAPLREARVWTPRSAPAGVTALQLHRVQVTVKGPTNAITLQAD